MPDVACSGTGRGARTRACSVHTLQKPSTESLIPKHFVGQVGNLRPIVNRPLWADATPLCGAANPDCSRLLAGSLRSRTPWFQPQETLPKGSSTAHVNAFFEGVKPAADWRGALWAGPVSAAAMPPCGTVNPGCSGLSPGLLRPRKPWFLPQETPLAEVLERVACERETCVPMSGDAARRRPEGAQCATYFP